ncbi:hypothetical protein MLD38_014354 [Melastoma candidum]|uniref:Uncharacterized protein n=1 Tax=Melastoma candidum TaxID=119954 RepID=A0ACB9RKY5_9MYRT|nr:hypothetical protein MLD38_014354 [Melastoma candidum]
MPRESRRSLGYRFVTCGDPTEVVECGSIRKSRGKYLKMEAVIENPRKVKSPVRLPQQALVEERGRGLEGSTVVQLSEVSRGAQELNRMIEMWSRGASFEGQAKDIAKDLMKGAVNLQESLTLLGKLQEATKYVAQLKQRVEKSEDAQKDSRFQKPRISADEALDGTYKFRRKEFDSICDVPSTSSSQSSTLNSEDASNYSESLAFTTTIAKRGGAGRSNVIAKLMGLEEIPRIDETKNSLRKKLAFETGVDKFTEPRFKDPRLGRESRSLAEILEGMRSKGILGNNLVGNQKCGTDDHPPIVVIKPFGAPVVTANEHLVQDERISRTEVSLKNLKLKEEIFRKFSDCQEKVDRSMRLDVENEVGEYDSSGCRTKVSDRMKEGPRNKKQLPTQTSDKRPKSVAFDRKPGKVQKVGKNSGRYSEEVSRSRTPSPGPRQQDYEEPTSGKLVRPKYRVPNKTQNETITLKSRTLKNEPNRRILEVRQKKASEHDSSPKLKQITVTIEQNEISAVECEKIKDKDNVSRRMEVNPVTTEASCSSTVTSTSMEEIDNAAAVLRLQEDSENKPFDLDSEDYHIISLGGDHPRAFTQRSDRKGLLWSDSTFLTHLEDLFGSFGICPTIPKIVEKHQPHSVHDKLYLDCANEFVERKNLHCISFASRGFSLSSTSMDKLIEEVSNGINNLNGWCKFADGHLSADEFQALLKRDVWSKGFASGTWEFGWKDGFSGEDVEEVVSDTEKMVLGWLIEEALADV